MTSDTILSQIRSLAATLRIEAIMQGRDLDYEEAKREAARQIAREHKILPPPAPPMLTTGNADADVRDQLFRRLQKMAANMVRTGYLPDAQSSLAERFAWFLFGSEEPPGPR
jgi:hypothetical protein